MKRRDLLKGAAIALCVPRFLKAQSGITKLSDKLAVIDAGGANVTAFTTSEGLVLVDSGAPKSADALMAALKSVAPNAKVTTLQIGRAHV